ncbi:MAG TPA: alpha/beta hydrolase-fold protein [Candidatus Eisenbacteria bacterium]|nr:alpha/beta hydrolase-fold protein [Candidatus Eisenbacteria bacterium]
MPGPAHAQWPLDGLRVCDAVGDQSATTIVPDGAGGAVAAWVDPRSGWNSDVWAQRLTPAGPAWAYQGRPATMVACWKYRPVGVPDGHGGVLLAWADDRCAGYTQVYVSHLTAAGDVDPGWPSNGERLCATSAAQQRPAIVSDGQGGAIVAWDDERSGATDVYARHVMADGTLDWLPAGVQIETATGDTLGPRLVEDGAGGAFLAIQQRSGASFPLRAARVSGAGVLLWDAAVCSASGARADVRAAADGTGGLLLAWADARGGDFDVYATRLRSYGVPEYGWPIGGRKVAGGAGDQGSPALAAAGGGAGIVAWAAGGDILAQRLAGDGSPQWGAGVTLCGAAGEQSAPALAEDGAGGAFAAWTDGRGASLDVYAAHVDSLGQRLPGWPADGLALCAAGGDQQAVVLAADGAGGAYAAWDDERQGGVSGHDVYAQRLLANGLPANQAFGLAAFNRLGQTFITWHCPPGLGWIYRVYRSDTPIASRDDLLHGAIIASLGDSSWCDQRLSQALGTACAYAVDSLAGPLATDQGLWVVTTTAGDQAWYAVTAQPQSYSENATITPGVNALADPLDETVDAPAPVYQRTIQKSGVRADVYALWTSPVDAPAMPGMANRPGLAFDCGVVRGAPGSALLVRPHPRGSDFTQVLGGSGVPGEWVLALDDPLPSGENTFWYGYHTGYNVLARKNDPPTVGVVVNYTERRVLYTLAWMRRRFPVDTMRVYAMGYSMGGIGSVMLAFERPDWIAAVMSIAGKFDFSFLTDPDTTNAFDPAGSLRPVVDGMWGQVSTDLETTEGVPVYQRLDFDTLAAQQEAIGLPPIVAFNGRYDTTVGWAEKIGFYSAMERHRQGGQFFWDTSTHTGGTIGWPALEANIAALYAFRSDRSYPALSHGSADDDPGDGHATSGDSLGTLNGYVTWDTSSTDVPDRWAVVLRLRDLPTAWGTRVAPDWVTVDVTPRRTQRFSAPPGTPCTWKVTRPGDAVTLQQGTVAVDSLGLVTVPAVDVWKSTGCLLSIEAQGTAAPAATAPARLALAPSRNPASGATRVRVTWPRAGAADVRVLDVSGRVVRTLWNATARPGTVSLPLEAGSLPSGIYFLRARLDAESVTRRLAVVH